MTEHEQIKAWLKVARQVPLRHVVKQFVNVRDLQKGVFEMKCPNCGEAAMGVDRVSVWHCFKCQDGGGQTHYLMCHGMTHGEALRWLIAEADSE